MATCLLKNTMCSDDCPAYDDRQEGSSCAIVRAAEKVGRAADTVNKFFKNLSGGAPSPMPPRTGV